MASKEKPSAVQPVSQPAQLAQNAPNAVPDSNFSLWNIWVASTLLKVLLFPAYHSTDFDVHRNWLSITKLLPINQWYYEHTSQWTLDYPPFFAYFEWVLSRFVPASVAADGCIRLTAQDGQYGSKTVIFQRSTVVVSECLLFVALQWLINSSTSHKEKRRNFVIACSVVMSPGFFIIDHIHFQYNGFLFSFLVLSIVAAKRGQPLMCAFWFATLLCFKHIFLYVAPAYGVYLFSSYCIVRKRIDASKGFKAVLSQLFFAIKWTHLVQLGAVVLAVFAVAFGPFIYYNQMPQLLSRLFPFSRGLTHAYWAPNFWALYSFADRVLIQLAKRLPGLEHFLCMLFKKPYPADYSGADSLTRGIVGDVNFIFLPNVPPKYTFLTTLFYQILSVLPLILKPTYELFVADLTYCAWVSFLFGWHVHEKAVMLIIVPFSFCVVFDRKLLAPFMMLTAAGYVSLFPLLYGSAEWLFKALITFVWVVVFFTSFSEVCRFSTTKTHRAIALDRINVLYIFSLMPMTCFVQLLTIESRNYPALQNFQFAGLMCYSVYCAAGVVTSWNNFSWLYFLDDSVWDKATN